MTKNTNHGESRRFTMVERALRKKILSYYKTHGRHTLPWRKTFDPYKILVSEIMLQQTQVERVIPYYKKWLKSFPTAEALAAAPLTSVLSHWSGLGYNSRAKRLSEAAKALTSLHKGRFPREYTDILALPGVGPYTAGAIRAFAFNDDVIMLETNIRTVLIHHLFAHRKNVSDVELSEALRVLTPKGKAREWYSALMDYGNYLKAQGVRTNGKSKHYTKQSTFVGSNREVRGLVLKSLLTGSKSYAVLFALRKEKTHKEFKEILKTLQKEGLIELYKSKYRLAS